MNLIVGLVFIVLINKRFTRLECKVDNLNDEIEKLNSRLNGLSEKLSKYE